MKQGRDNQSRAESWHRFGGNMVKVERRQPRGS
jgi:hypothetical protein